MSDLPSSLPPGGDALPPAPVEINCSSDEANYFVHIVDFYRPLLQEIVEKVPPLELLALLAFLQSALEVQMQEARGAFDEVREFFNQVYPALLHNHSKEHPEDFVGQNFVIVIPTPGPTPVVSPFEEKPRIIMPGNGIVN